MGLPARRRLELLQRRRRVGREVDDAPAREGDVGRRLNFLLQEIGREANTISSKASDAEIIHLVVDIKEECERLREQVQNLA